MPYQGIRMTRLLLITLLLLSSGPAYAEWVEIGTTDEGMTLYVDPETVRRKGNLVKLWQLLDFKIVQTVDGDSYLSTKRQSEYDCAEKRRRTLAFTWFSDNMGRGKPVYSSSEAGKWRPVAPESVGQFEWKIACNRK